MHPAHSQLIAEQLHAERLRNAQAAWRMQHHRQALQHRSPVRSLLGDALVGAGTRLASLGDRIMATASPPPTATTSRRSHLAAGSEGICAGC